MGKFTNMLLAKSRKERSIIRLKQRAKLKKAQSMIRSRARARPKQKQLTIRSELVYASSVLLLGALGLFVGFYMPIFFALTDTNYFHTIIWTCLASSIALPIIVENTIAHEYKRWIRPFIWCDFAGALLLLILYIILSSKHML